MQGGGGGGGGERWIIDRHMADSRRPHGQGDDVFTGNGCMIEVISAHVGASEWPCVARALAIAYSTITTFDPAAGPASSSQGQQTLSSALM